jgi:neutral ceramidase
MSARTDSPTFRFPLRYRDEMSRPARSLTVAMLLTLLVAISPQICWGAWKAGTSRMVITPTLPISMAGYAARKTPSEGKVQDLHAKALAIEDQSGTRLVIVTLDLIGVPRDMRDWLEEQVAHRYQLPPESLLLNASHTHCGPELRLTRVPEEGSEEELEQRREIVESYRAKLQEQLVDLVGEALEALEPAELDFVQARCGFAMNRRRPTDRGFINSPHSAGPVDHRVPVLRVTDTEGGLRAVLFGYACHNTTLGFNFICGDYAGYAQEYLEEANEGLTALFFMGCGGDQNPYPRSTLDLAKQHGRTLANAVEAALLSVPRSLDGPLKLGYEKVDLTFAPPPTREELMRLAAGTSEPSRGHARRLLDQLEEDGEIRGTYSYPIQGVKIGGQLLLIALAGETVVDYSLRLQEELAGPIVWVAGYSNDVFGYVPSLRVLREGGYEGGGAMLWGSLPGPFAEDVEERIVQAVKQMVKQFSQ